MILPFKGRLGKLKAFFCQYWSRICWCDQCSHDLGQRIFPFQVVKLGICKVFSVVPACCFHLSFPGVNSWTSAHFPCVKEYLYPTKFLPSPVLPFFPPLFHLCRWGNIWDVIPNLSVVGTSTISYRDFFQASCSTVEPRRKKRTAP